MDTRKFFGVVPAMATPFAADERFDEGRARELIEWYIASVHAAAAGIERNAAIDRISDVFAPLRAAWAWGSFPVVIKEAMALVGRDPGPARRPISPLPEGKRAQLKAVIDKIAHEENREQRTARRA